MKAYLGDGVYVEWSMESLVLTTENGVEVTNRIYLEPEVYQSLLEFVKKELTAAAGAAESLRRSYESNAGTTTGHE